MSLYAKIIDAFDARLRQFTRGGDVVVEAETYAPQQNRPYLSGRMAAYSVTPTGFGANCVQEIRGNYQINIMRPAREGKGPGNKLADALVAHFPRGAGLVPETGKVCHIEITTAMTAIVAGDWRTVPVIVSWYCTDP